MISQQRILQILLKKRQECSRQRQNNRRSDIYSFLQAIRLDDEVIDNIRNEQDGDLQYQINEILKYLHPSKDRAALQAEINQFQKIYYKKYAKKEEKSAYKIHGKELTVTIVYNPSKLDMNYECMNHHLFQYIKKFIMTQILNLRVRVKQSSKELRILNESVFTQDKYTNCYIFDPFFNMVKFILTKNDGKAFEKNKDFQIDTNDVKFDQLRKEDQKYWNNQLKFQSSDTVEGLIKYISTKEDIEEQSRLKFLNSLSSQGFKTVGDLLKVKDFQKISGIITQLKCSNQLQIELQKMRSVKIKSPFIKYLGNQQKLNCIKQGFSHKILRYVFMKSLNKGKQESLRQLNFRLPYLNQETHKKAIQIVKKQLLMQEVLNKILKVSNSFTFPIQNEYKSGNPMGMLFYGPPGTGKTRLTQQLAQLMGFHLVTNGLSATQFCKELVGQAKGVANSFLTRPLLSPHLICSMAIDEIDSVVVKRGGQQKSKGASSAETLSKFLSTLGGNQAIPNILLLASTNIIQSIDGAFLRRVQPHIYVGVPNKQQRQLILKRYLNNRPQIDYLTKITPNFTGAALQKTADAIINILKQKIRQNHRDYVLEQQQLLEITSQIASNLNIKFSYSTYQNLYKQIKGNSFKLTIFDHIKDRRCLITKQQHNFYMNFGQQMKYFDVAQRKQKVFYQYCRIEIPQALIDHLKQTFGQTSTQKQYIQSIRSRNFTRQHCLLHVIKKDQIKNYINTQDIHPNLYFIFRCDDITSQKQFIKYMKLQQVTSNQTGRMLVDLTQQSTPGIQYQMPRQQIKTNLLGYKFKPFLQISKKVTQVLPILVQQLMDKNLQIIQVIDSEYFNREDAFQQKQCVKKISNLQQQMRHYNKSGLIILLDSFIRINQSTSTSSTGDSKTLTINKPYLYQNILNLIQNSYHIGLKQERWISIVVKNKELLKIIKKDIQWPFNSGQLSSFYKQKDKKEQEEQKKKLRLCLYCRNKYTIQQNQKKKQCMMHFGYLVNTITFQIEDKICTIDQGLAKYKHFQHNAFSSQNVQIYKYSCCYGDLREPGCQKFHHYSGQPKKYQQDQLSQKKVINRLQTQKNCQLLKKELKGKLNQQMKNLNINNTYIQSNAPSSHKKYPANRYNTFKKD